MIEDRERMILLAGNKRQSVRLIDRDAVRVLDTGQFVSTNDFYRGGMDRDMNLIRLVLNGSELRRDFPLCEDKFIKRFAGTAKYPGGLRDTR